ncbi:MAG TPA: Eco57I restriction-modification methylase domain-containing protein [Elusimicrobiota bacterium]|nr:Eco57I restriction-modification methylase domain-containing protein [Elusimicrobiota bacterium]
MLNLGVKFPPEAYHYGERSSGETHGVVLTRPHIVNLILDLASYTEERDLSLMRLLEPSCGTGAFLVPAVRRLVKSARRHHRRPSQLSDCIHAYDIDEAHVEAARLAVETALNEEGIGNGAAKSLADNWVRQADFLLTPLDGQSFDAVVGNPPYIRIEQLSPEIQSEYRRRYESFCDRADLYVAFIERSLALLKSNGTLSFVCADRWTLNRYGAPLRRIISEGFKVKAYIDLNQTSPFESEVIAYPSIFAISPGHGGEVPVARLSSAAPEECAALSRTLRGSYAANGATVSKYPSWFSGDEPWVLSSPEHLRALRDLEARFAPIEADGRTRVRIGVATGCDAAYIVGQDADIEKDRLVPLVMRSDIENGAIKNNHRFVINTFDEDGRVINLSDFPRLRRHFEIHGLDIRRRHVAQKNPVSWFRTIDRVYPELVKVPKLLIPDIAGSNEVALDIGRYHPHHNLYFVTSKAWDMAVLGGLLSSKVTLFFIWSYATKMRGSYLRFQAQYLRRIRLPKPEDIPPQLAGDIRAAFVARDFKRLDALALEVCGLKTLPDFNFVDTRK